MNHNVMFACDFLTFKNVVTTETKLFKAKYQIEERGSGPKMGITFHMPSFFFVWLDVEPAVKNSALVNTTACFIPFALNPLLVCSPLASVSLPLLYFP